MDRTRYQPCSAIPLQEHERHLDPLHSIRCLPKNYISAVVVMYDCRKEIPAKASLIVSTSVWRYSTELCSISSRGLIRPCSCILSNTPSARSAVIPSGTRGDRDTRIKRQAYLDHWEGTIASCNRLRDSQRRINLTS